MATNQSVKNQLAKKNGNGGGNQPASPAQTIAVYLKKMGPEIEKALPKHMDADRMARIALTTIRTNPQLLECTVPSLMGAVMQAAQLGLEPGLIGHCYFVPFWNNKKKQREVQFIIGYKGMIDLARRSGHIESIYAHCVYENDEFEYELGLHPKLVHKPALKDRGKLQYVYAVAHFKDGGYQFEIMDIDTVEKIRKRSKAADNGPWVTDYEEMAKKTVLRRMWKYLPISVEVQQQAAQDETVRRDVSADPEPVYDDVIDITVQDSADEEEEQAQIEPEQKKQQDDKTVDDQELDDLFKQAENQ
ncbi:RecT protein [Caldalkalibacillus thermarum TA2.A1]|uniref:RecT protein n=1 Tax=Caldalkalibacillus thermarum (strain TA2.A1) TaxID=986075 RepID=F5L9D0_CALTT|nr:recombination protein RecT [Caldalkalibacillus thermarum]EGL82072.1 RecT protein [Caldalkalibacillus thermarum TA2.A1]QZT34011.1 recombination protein RecT [Caldalkalibacillus thermarum TA2.A1]